MLTYQMDADSRQADGCSNNQSVTAGFHAVEASAANTTAFLDAADIKMGCTETPVAPSAEIELTDDSIRSFLEKPFMVDSINWTNGRAQGYELKSQTLGDLLVSVTPWNNKIIGYKLVRGNFHVRVTVNASPMQAGALILHYVPLIAGSTTVGTTRCQTLPYSIAGAVSLVSAVQHPHVDLDVSTGTSCELTIPFIAPTSFYRMNTPTFDWGTFYLNVLSPLTVGASAPNANAEVTIYAYITDLELSAPLCPQMEKGDYISGAMKKIGKLPFPHDIPLISPALKTVSWVSNYVGGVASAFGWSKPVLDKEQTIVARSHFQFAGCGEGAVPSRATTLIASPEVEVIKSSITSEDEMSAKFLFSVPYLAPSVPWINSQATGTYLIDNFAVTPLALYQQISATYAAHTYTAACGAPTYYMSNFFQFYRGSIFLRLRFIKTKFHTGRLLITWSPGRDIATKPDRNTSQYSLREIVDLRDKSEIILNLPFMQEVDYLPMGSALGYLSVIVLNELRAPETVNQTIQILPYYWGGDDFEYAGLSNGSTTVYNLPFVPQSDNEDLIMKVGIGGRKIQSETVEPAKRSMSERFTSIKQLLVRLSQVMFTTGPPMSGASSIAIFPWAISMCTMSTATGLLTAGPMVNDPLSMFAPMYALYRGGMRMAVTQNAAIPINSAACNGYLQDSGSGTAISASNVTFKGISSNAVLGKGYLDLLNSMPPSDYNFGIADIIVPYQASTRTCPVHQDSVIVGAAYAGNTSMIWTTEHKPTMNAVFSSSSTFAATTQLYRAAADDFQLLFFVSAPPLLLTWV